MPGRRSDSRRSRSRRRGSSNRGRSESSGSALNDSDPDYPGIVKFKRGDVVYDRYEILKLAGQGTFGTAFYVYDRKRKKELAMKVIRSVDKYLDEAKVEIDILTRLADADPGNNSSVVRLYNHFPTTIRGNRTVCMVFEKLSKSLWDVIEKNNLRGFALDQVRDFGKQLFNAVGFCHKQKLTHTDLKPENILLCDDVQDSPNGRGWRLSSTEIRLIDFGGATFYDDHHSSMINTRQYRAPEVMLRLGWSYPSDVWSCGCVLAELLTGNPLFQTHRNQEHFALMEKILGKALDKAMAVKALAIYTQDGKRRSRSTSSERSEDERGRSPSKVPVDKLVDVSGMLKWPGKASASSIARVENARTLREQFPDRNFADLLEKCLTFDPAKRLTADEALRHPFFTTP